MSNTLFSASGSYTSCLQTTEFHLHMAQVLYLSDRHTEAYQHLLTALVNRLTTYGGTAKETQEVVAVLDAWIAEYASDHSSLAGVLRSVRDYVNSVPENSRKFPRPGEVELCSNS